MVDPVWSDRARPTSIAGPRRSRKLGLAFHDLPPIDLVLVTHNHYDHLDAATLGALVVAHDPQLIARMKLHSKTFAYPACAEDRKLG